jgi:AraC-like DNA-binding protein
LPGRLLLALPCVVVMVSSAVSSRALAGSLERPSTETTRGAETHRPVLLDRRGDRSRTVVGMTPDEIADLAHLRRARDLIDREYAQPVDVPAMARAALMSPAHFSRKFRAAYGETPYCYLMTRRIERAKALLRRGMSVTDACVAVGCTSLGSFSSRFTEIVGETPSQYRARDHRDLELLPSCVSMVGTRPRRSTVTV